PLPRRAEKFLHRTSSTPGFLLNLLEWLQCHPVPPRELLAGILELRQHPKTFFCAARQHELFVDKFQAVVRDRHQTTAHAEKAADREHGIWVLSIGAHEEVVDLTDGFF